MKPEAYIDLVPRPSSDGQRYWRAAVVVPESSGRVWAICPSDDPTCWVLPGGHVDQDEHPEAAARREAMEEAGLTVEITDYLGVLDTPRSLTHVYLGRSLGPPVQPQTPGEVLDVYPVEIDQLLPPDRAFVRTHLDVIWPLQEAVARTYVRHPQGAPGSKGGEFAATPGGAAQKPATKTKVAPAIPQPTLRLVPPPTRTPIAARSPDARIVEGPYGMKTEIGRGAHEHARERKQTLIGQEITGVQRLPDEPWSGEPEPIRNPLSKQKTGALAELLAEKILGKGLVYLDTLQGNFPVDTLYKDQEAIEIKGGMASNVRGAQHWRVTKGEAGDLKKVAEKRLSREQLAAYNNGVMKYIMARKKDAVAVLSKSVRRDLKPATLAMIINPETKIVRLFKFDGHHERIGWNSKTAKRSYVGTFRYTSKMAESWRDLAPAAWRLRENWDEGQHPRDDRGRFAVVGSDPGLGSRLEHVKAAGGSQGAQWYRDPESGDRFIVKTYGGDEDRLATEILAATVYKKLGVPVPDLVRTQIDGGPAIASKEVVGAAPKSRITADKKLADGFMADVLTANWDVVGLDFDNVLFKGDVPYRIDFGGSFTFRAMGDPKSYGTPTEHETLRDRRINPNTTRAYGEIPATALTGQAAHIAGTLSDAWIDQAVEEAGFVDDDVRDQVRDGLKSRRDWMADYAGVPKGGPKAKPSGLSFVSPSEDEDLTLDTAHERLDSPAQAAALDLSRQIDRDAGLVAKTSMSLGDTQEWGSENSMLVTYETGTYDDIAYASAQKGLKLHQKAVIPFKLDPAGPDSAYTLDLPDVDFKSVKALKRLSAQLDGHGLKFRTYAPAPNGGTRVVLVSLASAKMVDEDAHNVDAFSQAVGVDAEQTRGFGEIMGADDGTRESSAKLFRERIATYQTSRGRVPALSEALRMPIRDVTLEAIKKGVTGFAIIGIARPVPPTRVARDPVREADFDPTQHPRDEQGKFTSGGGGAGAGTTQPPPKLSRPKRQLKGTRVHTVDEAYALLTQKQKVILAKPRMVSTLLDKLAVEAKKAREAGGALVINLCDVSVEDSNIFCAEHKDISRIEMPQLSGKPTPGSEADKLPKNDKGEVNLGPAFREHLEKKLNIGSFDTDLPASVLKASQNELDGDKVSGIMKAMEAGKISETGARIFVSQDDYVVDGHHRWAAKVGVDLKKEQPEQILKMPVTVIKASIIEVLAAANKFADEMGIPPASMNPAEQKKKQQAAKTTEAEAEWEEEKHPRGFGGKFVATGAGGEGGEKAAPKADVSAHVNDIWATTGFQKTVDQPTLNPSEHAAVLSDWGGDSPKVGDIVNAWGSMKAEIKGFAVKDGKIEVAVQPLAGNKDDQVIADIDVLILAKKAGAGGEKTAHEYGGQIRNSLGDHWPAYVKQWDIDSYSSGAGAETEAVYNLNDEVTIGGGTEKFNIQDFGKSKTEAPYVALRNQADTETTFTPIYSLKKVATEPESALKATSKIPESIVEDWHSENFSQIDTVSDSYLTPGNNPDGVWAEPPKIGDKVVSKDQSKSGTILGFAHEPVSHDVEAAVEWTDGSAISNEPLASLGPKKDEPVLKAQSGDTIHVDQNVTFQDGNVVHVGKVSAIEFEGEGGITVFDKKGDLYIVKAKDVIAVSKPIKEEPPDDDEDEDDDDSYEADSWDSMTDQMQEDAKEAWMEDNKQDAVDSEIDNYKENYGDSIAEGIADDMDNDEEFKEQTLFDILTEDESLIAKASHSVLRNLFADNGISSKDTLDLSDETIAKIPFKGKPAGKTLAEFRREKWNEIKDDVAADFKRHWDHKAESLFEDYEVTPDMVNDSVMDYLDQEWESKSDKQKFSAAKDYDKHISGEKKSSGHYSSNYKNKGREPVAPDPVIKDSEVEKLLLKAVDEKLTKLGEEAAKSTSVYDTLNHKLSETLGENSFFNKHGYRVKSDWDGWPDNPLGITARAVAGTIFGGDVYVNRDEGVVDNPDEAIKLAYQVVKDARFSPEAKHSIKEFRENMEAYAKAQYAATQAKLKADGVADAITVYRGLTLNELGVDRHKVKLGKEVDFEPSSLASYSTTRGIGDDFGEVTVKVKIPREAILSYYKSGPGTGHEREHLVLGDHFTFKGVIVRSDEGRFNEAEKPDPDDDQVLHLGKIDHGRNAEWIAHVRAKRKAAMRAGLDRARAKRKADGDKKAP